MKKIRLFFNYSKAMLGGYFWKTCPVCGEYFGGYGDPKRFGVLWEGLAKLERQLDEGECFTIIGQVTCEDCKELAVELNEKKEFKAFMDELGNLKI